MKNKEIQEFLKKNYHQPVPDKRVWASYKTTDDEEWSHLTKEFSNRTQCQFEIIFGKIEDDTPNLQISLFTAVDNEWVQVFWGDIRNLDDLKFILDRIGIPYND